MNLDFGEIWRDEFDTLDKALLIIALLAAPLYIIIRSGGPFPADFIIKAMPAIFLGLLALKHVSGRKGILLCLALLFCAGGDIALALDRRQYFVYGLALFLVGHILFIMLFLRDFHYQPVWVKPALLLLLYGMIMGVFLIPRLGALLVPVVIYILVITSMGIAALFLNHPSKIAFYGSIFFILSDSFIALNKFLAPNEITRFLILPTYYIALFLIAGGYLFSRRVVTGEAG